MGIIKAGKVVVVLAGRFAGKKAIVVKNYDDGSSEKKFGHAIIAGLEVEPRKVTRSMNKKKIIKRSRVKPFVKAINYNHLLPTRYSVDIDLKKIVDDKEAIKPENRKANKKQIKAIFEERYLSQGKTAVKSERRASGMQYFFKRLRF